MPLFGWVPTGDDLLVPVVLLSLPVFHTQV